MFLKEICKPADLGGHLHGRSKHEAEVISPMFLRRDVPVHHREIMSLALECQTDRRVVVGT